MFFGNAEYLIVKYYWLVREININILLSAILGLKPLESFYKLWGKELTFFQLLHFFINLQFIHEC